MIFGEILSEIKMRVLGENFVGGSFLNLNIKEMMFLVVIWYYFDIVYYFFKVSR